MVPTSSSLSDSAFPLPGFSPEISVGEQIEITVSDGGTVVHSEVHTVTAAEIEAAFAGTTINITLTDIDVKADPDELYADGTSNSTIKVTVGGGVTEKPTITVDKGTLGDITDEGDGVYTVTYTAPSLAITFPPIDTALISAELTSTGQSASTVIVLLPVPTTVEVDIDRKEFNADTPGTGTVTVTVDRSGPITGESIAFTLNPSSRIGNRRRRNRQRRRHLHRDLHLRQYRWIRRYHRNGDPSERVGFRAYLNQRRSTRCR